MSQQNQGIAEALQKRRAAKTRQEVEVSSAVLGVALEQYCCVIFFVYILRPNPLAICRRRCAYCKDLTLGLSLERFP